MEDDDETFMCPLSTAPCIRAFCEDYGCADQLMVPLDENDFAAGSVDPDELVIPLPPVPGRMREES